MRVSINIGQMIKHFLSCLKSIVAARSISYIEVLLSVALRPVENIIHSRCFIFEMVIIDFEFSDDLQVPVFEGRLNTVRKWYSVFDFRCAMVFRLSI